LKIREILVEGARIAHPEDMVLTDGSSGAREAVAALLQVTKKPQDLTVKFDGRPALIFGRDSQGQFVLTDKSGFAARGYDGRATSPDQLSAMIVNRAGDPASRQQYASLMTELWPIIERAIPKNFRGFLWGDLMWSRRPAQQSGQWIFTPNTVTYRVPVDTPFGQQIGQSQVGIVVHQQFDADGTTPTPINKLPAYSTESGLLLFTPKMPTQPKVAVDRAQASKLTSMIGQQSTAIDALLNPTSLQQSRISDLPAVLGRYINFKVKQRTWRNLVKDFVPWLETQSKLSDSKINNIKQHIKINASGLVALISVYMSIAHLKQQIIQQLDQQDTGISSSIGQTPGGEGYVIDTSQGLIKLVDRMAFSAENFARNQ
jgi:hypothetical protein